MLPRSIGPRGRTILICELVTLGVIVGLGFALESVSPGWWGITKDAFSRLSEPGDPTDSFGSAVILRIRNEPQEILSSAETSRASDPEAFLANATYLITSPQTLRLAMSNPRDARLNLFTPYPEKDKAGAFRSTLHLKRIGGVHRTDMPTRDARGARNPRERRGRFLQ